MRDIANNDLAAIVGGGTCYGLSFGTPDGVVYCVGYWKDSQ